MLDGVLLDASIWLYYWLMAMRQFGLAGRWIGFPKGRECKARSNFGQPKAESNPTPKYTDCGYFYFKLWRLSKYSIIT